MFIEITKVLKTSDGVQRFVQYNVDGVFQPLLGMQEFLLYSGKYVNSQKNFVVVDGTSVRGKNCNLEFVDVLSRQELREKYPDRYVVLQNVVFRGNRITSDVLYGELVCTLKDSEYGKMRAKHMKEGKFYTYWRTTAVKGPFCGVIG